MNMIIPVSIKSSKVFKSARYLPCIDRGIFLIKFLPSHTFSFGIVITRKIGCAVERNFIKRRIRHALKDKAKVLKHEPKVAIVMIIKKEILSANFTKISNMCGEVIKYADQKNIQKSQN